MWCQEEHGEPKLFANASWHVQPGAFWEQAVYGGAKEEEMNDAGTGQVLGSYFVEESQRGHLVLDERFRYTVSRLAGFKAGRIDE